MRKKKKLFEKRKRHFWHFIWILKSRDFFFLIFGFLEVVLFWRQAIRLHGSDPFTFIFEWIYFSKLWFNRGKWIAAAINSKGELCELHHLFNVNCSWKCALFIWLWNERESDTKKTFTMKAIEMFLVRFTEAFFFYLGMIETKWITINKELSNIYKLLSY